MYTSFPIHPKISKKGNDTLFIRKTLHTQRDLHLKKKLRVTLRHILHDLNSNHLVTDAFNNIHDSRLSIPMRLIWCLALIFCLCLCVYQTYDRICYFLTYPVAVDVLTNQVDTIQFPLVSMCCQDTEAMNEVMPSSYNPFMNEVTFSDFNFLGTLISKKVGNLSDLWELTDMKDGMIAVLYEKMRNPVVIKPSLRCHPIGICNVYKIRRPVLADPRTRLEITIRHVKKTTIISTITGDIKAENQQWDMRNSWFLSMGITADIVVAVKKYTFLNTSTNFCASNEQYTECLYKCLKREHAELNFTCKYPFFPNVDLPNCTIDRTNITDYIKSARLYFRLDPVAECGCLKNCERVVFDWNEQILDLDKNAKRTVINVRFKENSNVSVSQRYIYDYVKFLGDIGGNFGLFLNLSILAICDIFYVAIKKLNFVASSRNQVGTKMRSMMYIQTAEFLLKVHKRSPNWRKWKLFRYCVLAVCVGVAIAQIVITVTYYLSNPISTSLVVTENRTIYFPVITLCGEGDDFSKLKKGLDPKDKMLYCPYDFRRLLELGNRSDAVRSLLMKRLDKSQSFAVDYWNSTFLGDPLSKYTTDVYNETFWELLGNSNCTNVFSPFGACQRYEIDPQVYGGTHSAVMLIHTTSVCDPRDQQIIQLYLNAQTDPFSLTSLRNLPTLGRTAVTLAAKKIKRINRPQSPCMDKERVNECRNKCLLRRLRKTVPCSLPFLNLKISSCSNFSTASEAFENYLNIVLTLNLRECGCTQPCSETIYDVRIHNEYHPIQALNSILIFFFRHNFIEWVTENYSYSFVTFLCNIGGVLGLALGVCILSAVDLIHTVVH